jgi:AcrR family transcriptional regulator
MPKVNEAYLQARRQQLLDAAMACFSRKGFQETTMQDISREAGVSYGVLYHYFRSKDEIIEAGSSTVAEGRHQRFVKAEQRQEAVEILSEVLRLNLQRWSEPSRQTELHLRIHVAAEGLKNQHVGCLVDGYSDYRQRYGAIVRRGQQEGVINPELIPDSVAQVFVALHEGFVLMKAADSSVSVDSYVDAVQALLDGNLRKTPGQDSGNGDHHRDAG